MSEAEALEIAMAGSANALSSFALYISFTFGYLTVAYFVGTSLTRIQALTASGLFLLAAGATAVSCIASCNAFETVLSEYPTILNAQPLWNSFSWQQVMSVVLSLGVLASLYFMYSIRLNGKLENQV